MSARRFSEKQRRLALWWRKGGEDEDADGVIAEGSIRSGKSLSMIVGFLLWSNARFKRSDFIVAGRSIGALKRNVVSPMISELDAMGWPFGYNRSEGVIRIGSNRYHLFGANNEKSQDVLQGMTAAGCLADEVALFPKSFVDQMVARCSMEGSKLWFNCNPSFPFHFFKTEWIDRAAELNLLHLHFTMDDNPALPESIRGRYEAMYTGVFHQRYILGLWTMAEGLIYPQYEDALEPRYGGPAARWCVSCDYGTQNAFAALKWAYDGSVWHLVDEYRYSGRDEGHQKTDADYVEDMKAFFGDLPSRTPFIVDPSAASFIAAMRREGFAVRKAKNNVLDGIRHTATCMQDGSIRIAETCEETRKEFAGYVWDEKQDGDRPVKENDHMMDALRYFVETEGAHRKRDGYVSAFERNRHENHAYNRR